MPNTLLIKKGQSYKFSDIFKFVEDNEDYEIMEDEDNSFRVGSTFVKVEHNSKDILSTFLLTGFAIEGIYECVYTDIK